MNRLASAAPDPPERLGDRRNAPVPDRPGAGAGAGLRAGGHPLLFLYEDADGVTGFKCRKPVLCEKSVLNALGFGGEVEGRSLFGVSLAGEAIARYRRAIVVEGEFDALGWYAASLAVGRSIELVAIGGSAKPTIEKFLTLRALGAGVVYLALDADPAGEASTAAACRCAWEAGLDVATLPMPPSCKDPDEVLARHGPTEGARLLFAVDRAEPGATWLVRHHLSQIPPTTWEQAAQLRKVAVETARTMPAPDRDGRHDPADPWVRAADSRRIGHSRPRGPRRPPGQPHADSRGPPPVPAR